MCNGGCLYEVSLAYMPQCSSTGDKTHRLSIVQPSVKTRSRLVNNNDSELGVMADVCMKFH